MKKTLDAVAHEDVFNGVATQNIETREQLVMALSAVIPAHLTNDDVAFLCIGTDRSTGDSLGPLVGMYLAGLGYQNVYGTLDEPVHAVNLRAVAGAIPHGKKVIAIDACLGKSENVGTFGVIKGGIRAGAGIGKNLGEYGDYAIGAVVNVSGFMEYFVLQSTRLGFVTRLAKTLTSALVEAFPLDGKRVVPPVEQHVRESATEVVARGAFQTV